MSRNRLPPPRDAAAGLGLVVLVLLLFPTAVFRGEVFYERDLHLDWYPRTDRWVRAFLQGSWPLWDNWIAFGQPLLADPSAQILYPLNWLNLLMQPWTYYTVFVVFHVALAGLGVYRLGQALLISRLGSFTAAAIWACSGPLLSLVNVHHLAGASLLPWVLLAAHAVFRRPGFPRAVVLGLVECAQVLAGSPDLCAMTNLLVAADALLHVDWCRPRSAANRRLVAHVALAATVTIGLSAALWLPALELARRSSRWALRDEIRSGWSVPLPGLLRALFPVFLNDHPLSDSYRAALFDAGQPFLASIYLGMPALGLAAASLQSRSARARTFLLAVAAAGVLVALGRHAPLFEIGLRLLPPLRLLRYPSKAMIVVAFAVSLLAGLGLDACRSSHPLSRARSLVVVLLVILLTVIGATGAFLTGTEPEAWGALVLGRAPEVPLPGLLRPLAQGLALGSVASASVLLLLRRPGRGLAAPPWLSAGVVLLTVGELFLAHRTLNATAPLGLLTVEPPAAAAVRSADRGRLYVFDYHSMRGKSERYLERGTPYETALPPGGERRRVQVLAQRLYLLPPSGAWWGVEGSYDQDVRGLYPTSLGNMVLLLRAVEGTPDYLRLLRVGAVASVLALHTEGLEGLVPVQTLNSLFREPIRVFRVPEPLPRVYVVGRARVAAGPAAFTMLLDPAFDPAREVILPAGPGLDAGLAFRGSSRIVEFRPDRVRLEADLDAPGYVVLVDAYDPGWAATLDGAPTPVLRANIAFRAVRVPEGRHSIVLSYRPRVVVVGLAVTGATALFLLCCAALRARRGRSSPPRPGS